MKISITPTDTQYGAYISGVDFSSKIDSHLITEIKELWNKYQVLIFVDQHLTVNDLEKFVLYFGEHCRDPFIDPINGSNYVAEVLRESNESTEIFAEGWHSDWFHMKEPPKGTALYAKEIPPHGGDTLFSDLYKAYDTLHDDLKQILKNHQGINSARRGYAPDARYGMSDVGRSMKLRYSDEAYEIQHHPLVLEHPETGKKVINCNRGYTIGIEGLDKDKSYKILAEIFNHQKNPKFIYTHRWANNQLVLWDNRCTLHRATGGYDGHRRSLYRITIK